jgi:hypothetical protein
LLSVATLTKAPPEPPPLLRLAHHVAVRATGTQRDNLLAWAAEVAECLGASVPEETTEVSRAELTAAAEIVRFLVAVEPRLYSADKHEVRTWHAWEKGGASDTPAVNKLSVEGIAALINNALRNSRGEREVELLLPIDLLAQGLGRWRVRVSPGKTCPIDARFRVKLRSWDRLYNRDDQSDFDELAVERWEELWQKLPTPGEVFGEGHCGTPAEHLGTRPVCLAASLAPAGGESDAGLIRNTLLDILVSGTPIALWPSPDRNGEGPELVADRLKELVINRRPDEVPSLVHEQRQGRNTGSDAMPHLCLLWDDPRRLPPGHNERLVSLGYN